MHRPTPLTEKEATEEIIKFDTILKGDLHSLIALFRDTAQREKKAHEETKQELQRVSDALYKARIMLPESPILSAFEDARPPSPIPYDGESYD